MIGHKKTLSSFVASIMGVCIIASPAAAAPKKLWEVTGFENPESALADVAAGAIYVSNVAGAATEKDGNGYISKLSLKGEVVALKWVEGLNAPKGLALHNGKLYTSDIDELVVIDVASGKVTQRFPAKGAKFLNDVTVDSEGRVYVSDMAADSIWRLEGDEFSKWLEDEELTAPNGLYAIDDKLMVAAWGEMTDGFNTEVPGHLLSVSLNDKQISSVGPGHPIGNLDGLEPVGDGSYLATDWMEGNLMRIDADGGAEELLDLKPGSADIGFIRDSATVLVPMMKDNTLVAYKVTL